MERGSFFQAKETGYDALVMVADPGMRGLESQELLAEFPKPE
jgi:hypothetical protein